MSFFRVNKNISVKLEKISAVYVTHYDRSYFVYIVVDGYDLRCAEFSLYALKHEGDKIKRKEEAIAYKDALLARLAEYEKRD